MRANSSIAYLPIRPACHDVPQAVIMMRLALMNFSLLSINPESFKSDNDVKTFVAKNNDKIVGGFDSTIQYQSFINKPILFNHKKTMQTEHILLYRCIPQ